MESHNHKNLSKFKWLDYKPLAIIVSFCLILSIITNSQSSMYVFMGYFFIFLSLFKFFDLQGFVDGFSTYDIIAKQSRIYGYSYPFIEFFLGICYLLNFHILLVNFITFVIMAIGVIGIVKSILSGKKIKCACLGTTLNIPLGTISIIENFGMGAMALYKLIKSII